MSKSNTQGKLVWSD